MYYLTDSEISDQQEEVGFLLIGLQQFNHSTMTTIITITTMITIITPTTLTNTTTPFTLSKGSAERRLR